MQTFNLHIHPRIFPHPPTHPPTGRRRRPRHPPHRQSRRGVHHCHQRRPQRPPWIHLQPLPIRAQHSTTGIPPGSNRRIGHAIRYPPPTGLFECMFRPAVSEPPGGGSPDPGQPMQGDTRKCPPGVPDRVRLTGDREPRVCDQDRGQFSGAESAVCGRGSVNSSSGSGGG